MTSCLDSFFGPKVIFEPSPKMYRVFIVSHYEHYFSSCVPVSNSDKVMKMISEAREKPPKIFDESKGYITFGADELVAEHFFASKADCDRFAQNLIDIGFTQK